MPTGKSKGKQVRRYKKQQPLLTYEWIRASSVEDMAWVHREVTEESEANLVRLARLINKRQAAPKLPRPQPSSKHPKLHTYTTTLLYPSELNEAIDESSRTDVKLVDVAMHIVKCLPASLYEDVFAVTDGLRQYGKSFGIRLESPTLSEQRHDLTTVVDEYLDIERNWATLPHHLTIGQGQLGALTNGRQVSHTVPGVIHFVGHRGLGE